MCGFVGYWQSVDSPEIPSTLIKMMDAIAHRGPDDYGSWVCNGVFMGHRRLAVVDLSPAGHQPMRSVSQRYIIIFNGEIYNHQSLRRELESFGMCWQGHSDTETLLAGFEYWGIRATIEKAIGMFAMAIWDTQLRQLHLVRDRLGEKPLYYGWQNDVFMFGSELKSLKLHPSFRGEINRDALSLYMRHAYIPAPHSIYQDIQKLEPGTILTLSDEGRTTSSVCYWSGSEAALAGKLRPFDGSAEHAVDHLESVLLDAVGQQMLADVPLGAFLSGGVDSSTVVALMQAKSNQPVKTFSIGFHVERYNEAEHAAAVARHLGTEHTELYVTPQQAMDVIPSLAQLYDEPFADSSQIPTFLVSQMARSHVTVALSGDAGDELFAGYNRYVLTQKTWRQLSKLPVSARRMLASGIKSITPDTWNKIAAPCMRMLPEHNRLALPGDKLHKAASVLSSRNAAEIYRGLVSTWPEPSDLVLNSTEPMSALTNPQIAKALQELNSDVEQMMAYDMLSYLPDDILVKVDRAAMGVSLETRVPFLDHRVVELAWQIPLDYKLRDGQSKWALRQVLYKHVPRELIERPKMGFGIPIDDWLRGPLREWAEELINPMRIREEGFFNYEMIAEKWYEHLSGKRNWSQHLWCVLMFQAWLENEKHPSQLN